MGEPDVILRLESGGELPAHSELLKVDSKVLRDVTRGTLKRKFNHNDECMEAMSPSVIPLGAGSISDMRSWVQSLAALYCFADGASDDDTWMRILVRIGSRLMMGKVSLKYTEAPFFLARYCTWMCAGLSAVMQQE